jgi:SAM-dependent methyltransferase
MTADEARRPATSDGPIDTTDWAAQAKRDWNSRAQQDARWHIASGEDDELTFSLSAMRDTCMILEDLHPHLRAHMRVLELGCGIGRLLRCFSLAFAEVWGIDVSGEMLRQAEGYLAGHPNVSLFEGDGRSLGPIPDGSVDLVYSYVVLQHVPDKAIVRNYIAETFRVLRPGGLAKLHVKTGRWRHQETHDTWHGVEIELADWDEWNRELGFELLNAYSLPDHPGLESTAWIVARKPTP